MLFKKKGTVSPLEFQLWIQDPKSAIDFELGAFSSCIGFKINSTFGNGLVMQKIGLSI
jgi:hypothetical protein